MSTERWTKYIDGFHHRMWVGSGDLWIRWSTSNTWYMSNPDIRTWQPLPGVTTLEEAQATALALWRMR